MRGRGGGDADAERGEHIRDRMCWGVCWGVGVMLGKGGGGLRAFSPMKKYR